MQCCRLGCCSRSLPRNHTAARVKNSSPSERSASFDDRVNEFLVWEELTDDLQEKDLLIHPREEGLQDGCVDRRKHRPDKVFICMFHFMFSAYFAHSTLRPGKQRQGFIAGEVKAYPAAV